MFFLPAAAHTEKDGSFTNTQRLLQWHHKAVEPAGRRPQRAVVLLPPRPHHPAEAGRLDRRARPSAARPDVGLPDRGPARRAERRGGAGRDQRDEVRRHPAVRLHRAEGRRLDRVRLLDLLRRLRRRRQPGRPAQARQRAGLGRAPSGAGRGRPTAASSTTARRPTPTGKSVERAQGLRLVGRGRRQVDRARRARLRGGQAPGLPAAGRRQGPGRARGRRPVHHAGRRQGLAVRADRARSTGRCPPTTSRRSRRCTTRSTASSATRRAQGLPRKDNQYHPSGSEPGSDVFPFVFTTYRLTEHHTAGGMSRWLPYLCRAAAGDVLRGLPRTRPERGLEHLGWATIVTARDGHRGAGPGHRPDGAAHRAGPDGAPDRAALPLGPQRTGHRRRGQRVDLGRAGPQRAHPGVEGVDLRHPSG